MSQAKPRRRNLKSGDRKKAIIRSAAELVEREGWERLNMSSLARHSGITRQLIHLHFAKLEDLVLETAVHLFQDVQAQTLAAVSDYPGISETELLLRGSAVTLDLPPGRAKALLRVITTAYSEQNELSDFARQVRRLVAELWAPAVARAYGLQADEAKHVSWLLVMAFWGAFHLIDDGELSKDEAIGRLDWMVKRILDGVSGQRSPPGN